MDTPQIRELFIEELEQVAGGTTDPVKDLYDKLFGNSTMACCEEGQCCNDDPW